MISVQGAVYIKEILLKLSKLSKLIINKNSL